MEDPPKLYAKADNIEITAHGMPPEDVQSSDLLNAEDRKYLTKLFYALIGIASSLSFFLALYWVLRLDSAITNVITNTYSTSLYFWPYAILALGAIVLFGINIALLIYRWRKFGPPKLKTEAGGGAGTLFGIAASACPVCGSTLLSAIGIAGGFAAFPLGGLELKALSFGFLVLPIWLVRKDLKELESDCASGVCPVPKEHSFKEADRPWLFGLLAAVIALSLISWNMLKTEPIIAKALAFNSFWFPHNYMQTALYFKAIKGIDWERVDPKVAMGKDFSSGSGSATIQAEVAKIPGLIPQQKGGASCGT